MVKDFKTIKADDKRIKAYNAAKNKYIMIATWDRDNYYGDVMSSFAGTLYDVIRYARLMSQFDKIKGKGYQVELLVAYGTEKNLVDFLTGN